MKRKGWDQLSPAYRSRLQRAGVTREQHERGEPLVRARGHFPTPITRPGVFRREKRKSELWNRFRHRARRLAAYDSIRREFMAERIGNRSPRPLEQTIEFYEALERQYAEEGDGGAEYHGEFSDWYDDMRDEWGTDGEWDYPELDLHYHGTTKG